MSSEGAAEGVHICSSYGFRAVRRMSQRGQVHLYLTGRRQELARGEAKGEARCLRVRCSSIGHVPEPRRRLPDEVQR